MNRRRLRASERKKGKFREFMRGEGGLFLEGGGGTRRALLLIYEHEIVRAQKKRGFNALRKNWRIAEVSRFNKGSDHQGL